MKIIGKRVWRNEKKCLTLHPQSENDRLHKTEWSVG